MAAIGRPAFVPSDRDRALVRMLASIGTDQDAIARALGASKHVLRKYFRVELDRAYVETSARVARELYDAATNAVVRADERDADGKPTGRTYVADIRPAGVIAAKWWTQARMGWTAAPSGAGRAEGGRGRSASAYAAEPPRMLLLPGTEDL